MTLILKREDVTYNTYTCYILDLTKLPDICSSGGIVAGGRTAAAVGGAEYKKGESSASRPT